jgi:cobalt-zinc-cadmium efflux system membrane fusion protein
MRIFNRIPAAVLAGPAIGCTLIVGGCNQKTVKADPTAEAPPLAQVEHVGDPSIFKVDDAGKFPVTEAKAWDAAPELNVTGVVSPDVSRSIPVISLATGRVVEVDARLGDAVTKGQLMLRVQSPDISGAFSDYRQAVSAEKLSKSQLDRAQTLYDKGAIAQKDLEVAQDAETRAAVTVDTTAEHLRVLGVDKDHPNPIVDIFAPVSGVVTDQQVTNSAGIQGLSGPNPFTISDLSHVWIICDVFENDLSNVRIGQVAEIRLNAYSNRIFHGVVNNIGPILDPNIRTAKVRLEMENPGLMRMGMFVTATFRSGTVEHHAAVPSSAILHLHDREWVYEPAGGNSFRRVEIRSGKTLPEGMQEVVSGVAPGDRLVNNALVLQSTAEQ